MPNMLNAVRYSVLVSFIILNAVIVSIAVWNLSILNITGLTSAATHIDTYLIFTSAFGLVLVFPIIFADVCGKDMVIGRVWFELVWVGLFCVLDLVGAAFITSQSNSQLCEAKLDALLASAGKDRPCASAQVLQTFTWICSCLLLGYFVVLLVFSLSRAKRNPAIWLTMTRQFPWYGGRYPLDSQPDSPVERKPRKERRSFFAPRASRIVPFAEAFVSRPQWDQRRAAPVDRPVPPVPAAKASQQPPIRPSPFYPSYIQETIEKHREDVSDPAAFQFPQPAEPLPPLGDWPRLDALSRPVKAKPKPLPGSRIPPPPSTYNLDASALTARLESITVPRETKPALPKPPQHHAQQDSIDRTRPIGPRTKQGSGDYRRFRPPNLDLSKISTHRS